MNVKILLSGKGIDFTIAACRNGNYVVTKSETDISEDIFSDIAVLTDERNIVTMDLGGGFTKQLVPDSFEFHEGKMFLSLVPVGLAKDAYNDTIETLGLVVSHTLNRLVLKTDAGVIRINYSTLEML
jgi:hypothetical protein